MRKRRFNILHIIDGLRAGGKERQLIELIKHIDRLRFCVGVVTFNKNQHYFNNTCRLSDYFRVLEKRNKLKPLFTIWKCFQEFIPDIVHTWDSLSSFYSYLPIRVQRAAFIDGSIRDAGIDKGWQYHYKRFYLKRADMVLSNSHAGLKAYHVAGEVLYNALDLSRFMPNQNLDKFNIIMTANFTDYKDHATFFKAAKVLAESGVVDQVLLAGDGPRIKHFQEMVIGWDRHISIMFHFLGQISNVEEYLSRCRIGVLCSTARYSEGISNSVLEYMAAGLIPITTDIGAIPEIICNGVNGLLFKAGDWEEIVRLVTEVKMNPALQQTIMTNARKTIEEKFDCQSNIGKCMDIYLKLLHRDGR